MIPDPGRTRWLVPLAWLATLAVAAGLGVWAGQATLTPPAPVGEDPAPALYRVPEGTVSRVQTFTATAEWRAQPVGRSGSSGTVTTVDVTPGQAVDVGDRLYSVDLRPVVAAAGDVPSFRSLARRATGADVRQLQRFLVRAGSYKGKVSGSFDAATEASVKRWQRELGVTADGVVRRGDLVFLPSLPARLAPTDALVVGAPVGPGDLVLELLSAVPAFSIPLRPEQADLVPLTGQVVVHAGSASWDAVIANATTSPAGELVLELEAAAGGAVCGDACAQVPVGAPSQYRADIVAVPETTGPLVPSAALRTRTDGATCVVDEAGRELEVTVLAAADGRAVVEGIELGQTLRLFGEPAATGGSPAQGAASTVP